MTETINKRFPATTETIKKPATETSPKKTKTTRNRSIHSKMLDPPAAAESTKNPATETIKQCFPCHNVFLATTETIKKANDGSHKQTFPSKTETINKNTETIPKKTLDDVEDGNH